MLVLGNIDTGGNPALNTSFVVFQPPAGIWNISVQAAQSVQHTANALAALLLEIKSGTDDALIATGFGYQGSSALFDLAANRSTGRAIGREIETDGTKQFYWLISTYQQWRS